ncbi:MAG TPA: IS1595 family transposase [Xanthobacteraceae bacterium]|nr:IS1595 family transposase [Xanthobacteraceae bacterium]
MAKWLTIQDFMRMFPDDDACLEHLFRLRYGASFQCPRCGEIGKFKKLAKMPAYTCQCGEHVHPMVGTPFGRTHVPLQKWFYAMYLFTTTRHGVPAKELQRQLSVNYKTAWRIGHELRKYLAFVDGDDQLSGHVEADETMIGGKRRGGKRGRGAPGKTTVFGMLERGGDVMTRVVENVRRATLEPHILSNVKKGATVSTDELKSYAKLARLGYKHGAVNHAKEEWVNGIHHTQGIEGFWSILKRSIRGTHVHVSRRHLPKYLAEFEFRWNLRTDQNAMFPLLLKRLAT